MKQLFGFKKGSLPLQAEVVSTEIVKAERERVESERMSRRAALRKIGIMSGGAVLALVSGDDLARMAAKQMQEHKETKAVGDQMAKDFHGAGVAFADSTAPSSGTPITRDQCKEAAGYAFTAAGLLCSALALEPPLMAICGAIAFADYLAAEKLCELLP